MELVDREKLIAQYSANPESKGFMELVQDDCVVEALKKAEVVDAVPVIHAKWISEPGIFGDWYCSNCKGVLLYEVESYGGGNYHDIKTVWSTYCPHCGAKMDLEDK